MLLKKFFISVIFISVLVANLNASDIKYGFVDSQKVANSHPIYKSKLDLIEKKMAPQKEELQKMDDELKALRMKLQENPYASKESMVKLENLLKEKKAEMRKKYQQFQLTAHQIESKILPEDLKNDILKQVLTAIQNVSKSEGFQVVYEINDAKVVYLEPSFDLTDRAIAEMLKLIKLQKKNK